MNDTVESDFLDFPKAKWLGLTGEVDRCVRFHVKFSQDLTFQKSLKSVNFWQSYSKNKNLDVFGTLWFLIHLRQERHVNYRSCNVQNGCCTQIMSDNFIYLFTTKFVQLGTQIKTQCKKENIQKYTKSTLWST